MMTKFAASLALCALLCGTAEAGPHAKAAGSRGAPRLEGFWFVNFLLPMEATPKTPKLVVSEAEAKVIAASMGKDLSDLFGNTFLDPELPQLVEHMDGLPVVRGERRTRAVVLPANGMLPYTAAARKEADTPPPDAKLDNPEDRSGAERCLVQNQAPLSSFTFDDEMEIVVTKDEVVLYNEYGGDVRIVPITDRHRPKALTSRMGDSIGRWEGKTLVIETVGLPDADRDRFPPVLIVPGESKVIERLTPVSDKELLYQFTVIDPKTYTAPWLGEFSWRRTTKPIFESACHEGNYSLPNMLAGARHEEALARAGKAAAHVDR